jgi:RloB-like protein
VPRREAPSGRRPARRRSRPLILVVCGSAKTESTYLRELRNSVGNPAVDITLVNRDKSPLQVVEYAIDFVKRDERAFDEVWCVFDVDQFDIDPAVRFAQRSRLELAVSNPCFELWLLLHHDQCKAFCAGYDDVVDRLRRHLPTYDKTCLRFADFAAGVSAAVERARELEPDGSKHDINPSTSVWRLVERITQQ